MDEDNGDELEIIDESIASSIGNTNKCVSADPTFFLSLNIPWIEFSRFLPTSSSSTRLRGDWCECIYEKFHNVFPSCALVFKGNRLRPETSRKSNARKWYGTANCKVQGCIKVTFEIQSLPSPGSDVKLTVKTYGHCIHNSGDNAPICRRPLKGQKRQNIVQELKISQTQPKSMYFAKLSQMNDVELKTGNITHCQTPQILKQASHESSLRKRLCIDVFEELIVQQECWNVALPGIAVKGFIQCLGHTPFYVTFYTDQQLQMYVDSCVKNVKKPTILHFDCTGSVVKKIPNQKAVYYYTLLHADSNIPVFEFISTCHTSRWITNMLNTFLTDVRKCRKQTAKPSVIVTDFSYALMNAVLGAFNDMTLPVYLRWTYKLLTSPDHSKRVKSTTFLCICKAHMMKALSMKLSKTEHSSLKRKACLVIFARLQDSTSLKVSKLWLCTVN